MLGTGLKADVLKSEPRNSLNDFRAVPQAFVEFMASQPYTAQRLET